MEKYMGERGLALTYPLIIGLSLISSVTSAIVWTHWKSVLNPSIDYRDTNYGCFLYEVSIYSYLQGGHSAFCYFASYGLILPIIFAIIFGSFHMYRVCISGKGQNTGTIHRREGGVIVVTAQAEDDSDDISPYYWIPSSVVSVLMGIYTLVYASIFSDGFLKSCNQFRNELTKTLHASGKVVEVIQGRLSCSAVFDFMDYTHEDGQFGRHRPNRINSAACFYIVLLTCWITVFLWIATSIINIHSARKSRTLRV